MDEKSTYAIFEEMENLWLTLFKPLFKARFGHASSCRPPLPLTQMATLVALAKEPMISMSKLARIIVVSNQQLTRIADELEKSGYVVRVQNPDNRRQTLIHLTDSGMQILEEQRRAVFEMLKNRLAQLDEQDVPAVLESIQTIRRAIGKIR